jgi:uncharacterized protein (PEP-CTERM system associated)
MDTMRTMLRASSRSTSRDWACGGFAPRLNLPTRRIGRRKFAAVFGGIALQLSMPAFAQSWHIVPSVSVQETLTSNVNLSEAATAKGDLVTQVTPQLTISERGPRTSLQGDIAAPALVYVRTGAENNQVYPSVNLIGSVEGIERFFFVEGAINVSQQFFTPFGAQPQSLANATQNRYTTATYRVTPYVQGVLPNNVKYELRNNNSWTNLSGAPIATNNSYTDEWKGRASSPLAPFGWALDYDWTDVKFTDQRPTTTQLVRATLRYQADPQLRFDLDGGYEDNQYPFVDYRGAIYGAGVQWNPTERTNVAGNWEHRFFGSSYLFNFDHRTPLSAINVQASRNTTSYPQQFLSIPATGNVPLLLNFLLQSRIPDPAQRLNAINQLLQSQGLPSVLDNPVNLYSQETYLLENASVTLGLLGARNNLFFTGFYAKTQPITGAGTPLPGYFSQGNNNTQTGASVAWTRNLTAMMTLNATCTVTRTVANAPLVGTTNQGYFLISVTAPLSGNSTISIGARYQVLHSDVAVQYNEAAVIAGLNYVFK